MEFDGNCEGKREEMRKRELEKMNKGTERRKKRLGKEQIGAWKRCLV